MKTTLVKVLDIITIIVFALGVFVGIGFNDSYIGAIAFILWSISCMRMFCNW